MVDNTRATCIFREAAEVARSNNYKYRTSFAKILEKIVLGEHLTFRYILVTALLAKATDPRVNALSLQARSGLSGAYDARSVCHKIIVPLEKELLCGALGSSNEPFLNKPARLPALDKNNPVRGGADKALLDALCDFLPQINDSDVAFDALCDSLALASKRNARLAPLYDGEAVNAAQNSKFLIKQFIRCFLMESHEGETVVLIGAACLRYCYSVIGNGESPYNLKVHPTNQSGASSKEICDIDVVSKFGYCFGIEVKDKPYTQTDAIHALDKVLRNGQNNIVFLEGPRVSKAPPGSIPLSEWGRKSAICKYGKERNVDVAFWQAEPFIQYMVSQLPYAEISEFIDIVAECAAEARVKDSTRAHVRNCLEQLNLITRE